MCEIWDDMTPPLRPEHVARLAVGQKVLTDEEYSDWEAILSEIIVGNAFGVDRIDYLLRDSLHTGVGYGKFDHHRLLDTLWILPSQDSEEPILGIEAGGVHSAQALLLARYFMYAQVYFHQVRRMYDKHLIDFLRKWLPQGRFPTSSDGIQRYTDVEVMNGIREAAKDSSSCGHDPAIRIMDRQHYKRIYSRVSGDVERHPTPGLIVYRSLCERYGQENVYHDYYEEKDRVNDIRVLSSDDRVFSESEMLESIPQLTVDRVYINPAYEGEAVEWLKNERENILDHAPQEEEEI